MKTSLVIMAAGMGSRFGGGIKQLTPMGPNGELIIDYSIYDALEAGFDRIIFIIRKDLEKDFKAIIGDRIAAIAPVEYAYQETDDLPAPFVKPADRSKPWGTGHAILAARDLIKEPFAVINADDYYGKTGFRLLHDYLVETAADPSFEKMAMAGFILGNTLSDNGSVKRGVCTLDEQGNLTAVNETFGLVKTPEGAGVETEEGIKPIPTDSLVSMNMWGFMPSFIKVLEERFVAFLEENVDKAGSEYLLPEIVDAMIKEGKGAVKVLPTPDQWFGVTYKEDTPAVKAAVADCIARGIYKTPLFD
ncbi:MAG: NTP transferase domain-containing protein [Lachnospiraceae bacterium]|nr:NTP transferase domain-containing protein [Lachnospiraceae bacterium]